MPHPVPLTDLLRPIGVGVNVTTAAGVSALEAARDVIQAVGRTPGTGVLRAPQVIPGDVVERADYLIAFPHLIGAVRSFDGSRDEHRALVRAATASADWSARLDPTGLVLTPTACHSVYALLEGTEADGYETEITATCFRHEPSEERTRLQAFTMLEYVYVGTAAGAAAFAARWRQQAVDVATRLGLDARLTVARDPFFGAAGQLVPSSTPDDDRKAEVVVDHDGNAVAVASVNAHGDHFGRRFRISSAGGPAHSACVGFGLERVVACGAAAGAAWVRDAVDGASTP